MEEQQYASDLLQIPRSFSAEVSRRIIPKLDVIAAGSSFAQVHDSKSDDLDALLDEAEAAALDPVDDDWVRMKASRRFQEVSAFNRKQLTARLAKALGIGVWFSDPWYLAQLKSFQTDNLNLIKGATLKQKTDLKQVILNGIRGGRRVEDLAADVKERFLVAESRVNLIARDQVAKLFGNMNMLRQSEVGIRTYYWRTMLDERVRPTHEDNEGLEFAWNSPPAVTGHPGDDYQCRCTAEPNLSLEAAA